MRKLIIFFLASFCLFCSQVQAEECNYKAEIDKCNNAVKDGDYLSITDFVCISSQNAEKRAYQIVLDKKFREVDDIAEEYLISLEQNKDYYFGENKQEDYLQASDTIEKNFGEYGDLWGKYKVLCDRGILEETLKCLGTTTVNQAKDFLKDDKGDCMGLVSKKLEIYNKVAYDTLKLDKQQVRKDSRKKLVQKERDFYDKLSDLFSINLGYLERIWMKTNTMTSKPK